MIAICCADPAAPCTKGRVRGCTPSEVPFPMKPLNFPVEMLSQSFGEANEFAAPAGGIPLFQLALAMVNFRQLGSAVGFGGSHPPFWFGTYDIALVRRTGTVVVRQPVTDNLPGGRYSLRPERAGRRSPPETGFHWCERGPEKRTAGRQNNSDRYRKKHRTGKPG